MLNNTEIALQKFYQKKEEKIDAEYNDIFHKFKPGTVVLKKNLPKSLIGIDLHIPKQKEIESRIEKAKELVLEDKLSLKQIAVKLGYSSLQHFSSQFKTNVGMTPTFYRTSLIQEGLLK